MVIKRSSCEIAMDSLSGNTTLDRIQKEIQETLEREDELKNGYSKLSNGNGPHPDNGTVKRIDSPTSSISSNDSQKSNGFKKFTPNTTTKGVMHKFFKSRGKVSMSAIKSSQSNGWASDAAFQPAKVTVEKGKPVRNGYVPAEEKIVKELQEFQIREAELRQERRKSQPNLMAALELEEAELEMEGSVLKPAKSMASLYKAEEDEVQGNHSAPCSLKPARSLAALCDLSDDEAEMPGTYSLIMQFEGMKGKEARS
ncbi:hypothetical protein NQ315_002110 [Exocentrus adspersus]|uniref:A-kinase anchor protein 2 C-terminal domain-containing protein n=1 Tax=Exocentrus adspersus TaxID=1586481 RepID=A0AAV8VZ25_9CUCU|nr:hypothetical protein NQ315_002110 [Exocentrus adspersus]